MKTLVILATLLLPILVCLSVIANNSLFFVIALTIIPIWSAVIIQLQWEDLD
jgi:hypothetical protein